MSIFLYSDWSTIALCQNTAKSQNRGYMVISYGKMQKYREKQCAIPPPPTGVCPGVFYIFGGRYDDQNRPRCSTRMQLLFFCHNPVRNRVRKNSHLSYILAISHQSKITTFNPFLPIQSSYSPTTFLYCFELHSKIPIFNLKSPPSNHVKSLYFIFLFYTKILLYQVSLQPPNSSSSSPHFEPSKILSYLTSIQKATLYIFPLKQKFTSISQPQICAISNIEIHQLFVIQIENIQISVNYNLRRIQT